MARSLLHMKLVAACALSRYGSHGSRLGSVLAIQTMREYSVAAANVELLGGLNRSDPKQGNDKAAAGYRQKSWMRDPVTGYYIPEDHFGETDIAQERIFSRNTRLVLGEDQNNVAAGLNSKQTILLLMKTRCQERII